MYINIIHYTFIQWPGVAQSLRHCATSWRVAGSIPDGVAGEFFPENFTVQEIMSTNWVETEGPQMTSHYEAYALHAGLARLYALMNMNRPTRTRTHTHTQTNKYYSYCFSTATTIRERASLLRYTYNAPLVLILDIHNCILKRYVIG
jgi:hypothetical protein